MDTNLKALKELGQFMGRKFDALSHTIEANKSQPHVEVNMGQLTETMLNLTRMVEALETIARSLEHNTQMLSAASLDTKEGVAATIHDFIAHTTALENAIKAIPPPEHTDLTPMLRDIVAALTDLKTAVAQTPPAELNFAPIIDAIKAIKPAELNLGPVLEALKKQKIEFPKTIKLPDDQVAKMSLGGGGTALPMDMPTATTIANVAATATNTEYTYTFPTRTIEFTIKLRDQGTLGYYAWTTGTLPLVGGGGDASKYMTIPQNFLRSVKAEYGGKTIYLGAESASQVFEIESFQR